MKNKENLLDIILMLNNGDFMKITLPYHKRIEYEKKLKEVEICSDNNPPTWSLIDKDHSIRCDHLIGYYFQQHEEDEDMDETELWKKL